MIRLLNIQIFEGNSFDSCLEQVSKYFSQIPSRIVNVETVYNTSHNPHEEYPEVKIRVWWIAR